MTVHFITGHLGSGKGLYAVQKIIEYIGKGKPVYTNIDIFPDKFYVRNKTIVHRMNDFPTPEEFERLPQICPAYERDKFGALVLDEVSYFLSSRTWNEQGRGRIVRWLKDARKLGYDVYLIVQDIESIDSSVKRSLEEITVTCTNVSNFKVPLIGWIASLFGVELRMPRAHVASSWYKGLKTNTEFYSGSVKYCYDTGQLLGRGFINTPEGQVDLTGPYTILSAWHIKGRYLPIVDVVRLLWQWPYRWIPAVFGGCTFIPYVGCR